MLDVFDIIGILHFGISGNLNNSLSIGDVIVPKSFAQTGLWDWLVQSLNFFLLKRADTNAFSFPQLYLTNFHLSVQKPNATVYSTDVAELDIGNYNVPKEGYNQLGLIGYSTEQFYSESGEPNSPQGTIWFPVTETWLESASSLEVRSKKKIFFSVSGHNIPLNLTC